MCEALTAPFPWFGGKRRVASLVWERLGDRVGNYVEPFFGSGAVLLGRPGGAGSIETVNDADGHLANVWRAIRGNPEAMAAYACDLAHECDLHARHAYLVRERENLTRRLEGDPDYYDVRLAGWWLWGICLWIGGGWCSGEGPWQSVETEEGWQLLHLGDAGRGVNRQLLHLGDAGRGVQRRRLHNGLGDYMAALARRMARVRVCCGDWRRVCGPTPTVKQGLTAVFLDPPYGDTKRDPKIYAAESMQVAGEVWEWCQENGDDPRLRIALCGYEGEHEALEVSGWACMAWKAQGGYGSGRKGQGDVNKNRERIWFSPHCLMPLNGSLFEMSSRDGCNEAATGPDTIPAACPGGPENHPTEPAAICR